MRRNFTDTQRCVITFNENDRKTHQISEFLSETAQFLGINRIFTQTDVNDFLNRLQIVASDVSFEDNIKKHQYLFMFHPCGEAPYPLKAQDIINFAGIEFSDYPATIPYGKWRNQNLDFRRVNDFIGASTPKNFGSLPDEISFQSTYTDYCKGHDLTCLAQVEQKDSAYLKELAERAAKVNSITFYKGMVPEQTFQAFRLFFKTGEYAMLDIDDDDIDNLLELAWLYSNGFVIIDEYSFDDGKGHFATVSEVVSFDYDKYDQLTEDGYTALYEVIRNFELGRFKELLKDASYGG